MIYIYAISYMYIKCVNNICKSLIRNETSYIINDIYIYNMCMCMTEIKSLNASSMSTISSIATGSKLIHTNIYICIYLYTYLTYITRNIYIYITYVHISYIICSIVASIYVYLTSKPFPKNTHDFSSKRSPSQPPLRPHHIKCRSTNFAVEVTTSPVDLLSPMRDDEIHRYKVLGDFGRFFSRFAKKKTCLPKPACFFGMSC